MISTNFFFLVDVFTWIYLLLLIELESYPVNIKIYAQTAPFCYAVNGLSR